MEETASMTNKKPTENTLLAVSLFEAWSAVERILNGNLGMIRGITYSEYRLLSAIAAGPEAGSSRADLARTVGLSPSAVTGALRPLSDLGMVETIKHPRDARLALAHLTAQGEELVADAAAVVQDAMAEIVERTPGVNDKRSDFLSLLGELASL